jgi:hypothetical protein
VPRADRAPIAGYQSVYTASAWSADDRKQVRAFWPRGTQVLGGGAEAQAANPDHPLTVAIQQSAPYSDGGWYAEAYETTQYDDGSTSAWQLDVYAFCGQVQY